MSTLLDQIRIEREQVDAMLLELRKFPVMWKPFTPIKFGISDFSTLETQPDGTTSVRVGPVVRWAKFAEIPAQRIKGEIIEGGDPRHSREIDKRWLESLNLLTEIPEKKVDIMKAIRDMCR